MNQSNEIAKGPFEPTLESLKKFECPEWFRDAKFGIWSHWGPQSVPMYGDWYARHMYMEGSPQYLYHWRKYGHPSKFGYKDIIKLWKAENFDPAGLMDLFVEAGAQVFRGQAMHHDNFDNFNSAHNPWNSVNMGPMQDICALWQAEARRHGLAIRPFGASGARPTHGFPPRMARTRPAPTPACPMTARTLPTKASTATTTASCWRPRTAGTGTRRIPSTMQTGSAASRTSSTSSSRTCSTPMARSHSTRLAMPSSRTCTTPARWGMAAATTPSTTSSSTSRRTQRRGHHQNRRAGHRARAFRRAAAPARGRTTRAWATGSTM